MKYSEILVWRAHGGMAFSRMILNAELIGWKRIIEELIALFDKDRGDIKMHPAEA